MRVEVKLYATLSRFAAPGTSAGAPFEVELPGGATIGDLVGSLKIPAEEAHIVFVNGEIRGMDWLLKHGDQVGVFPPIGGGGETEISIDVWLYGELARYAGEHSQGSYANLSVKLSEGSTLRDLLACLQMPTEERGITFINGQLSALPGKQPDMDHPLEDGNRVALFHLRSMWPFQYRFGVAMVDEMSAALREDPEQSLRHSYKKD